MLIKKISEYSGKTNTKELDVTQEQLNKWRMGELIQNVMPNLSADEREFLMTGITSEEWNAMFPKEEEL